MIQRPEEIVFIKRKQTFIEEANADPEVADYFGMSYRAIGSFYKSTGKQYGSGLTKKEEMILMPEMIGFFADLDKREYHKGVAEFYRNINTKIPSAGLRLNIALENKEEDLSETNMPVSLRDYIIFRHAMAHPETGANLDEAEMYQHKRFYLENPDEVTSDASVLSKKEDNARLEYYKVVDDMDKVEMMLVLLGVNTSKMNADSKVLTLKEFTTLNMAQSASFNESKLDRFVSISKDKYLKIKYTIEDMINSNVLERVNMQILITETGDIIGEDLKEASVWFQSKANTKNANVLKARLKEFKK